MDYETKADESPHLDVTYIENRNEICRKATGKLLCSLPVGLAIVKPKEGLPMNASEVQVTRAKFLRHVDEELAFHRQMVVGLEVIQKTLLGLPTRTPPLTPMAPPEVLQPFDVVNVGLGKAKKRVLSEATRKKMSAAQKRRWRNAA